MEGVNCSVTGWCQATRQQHGKHTAVETTPQLRPLPTAPSSPPSPSPAAPLCLTCAKLPLLLIHLRAQAAFF
jgi:hypothetical protein